MRMACPHWARRSTADERDAPGLPRTDRAGHGDHTTTVPRARGERPRMTDTVPAATGSTPYIGRSLPRREDAALITGRGTWTDDITPPGVVHLALVRSPVAHARIAAVDTAAAREQPGVVAVLTGHDVAGEFVAGIPTGWPVTEDILVPDHPPLARDEVNHVGDAVAVVVATEAAAARDAAELVVVDYDELPGVFDVEAALAPGAPLVHEQFGTNHCYTWPLAVGDVDAAPARADVVVEGRYVQQRVIPSPIEPRAVMVTPDVVG